MRRMKSGLVAEIQPFSAIGLKAYKDQPFIAIDWDARTVTYDFGAED
jgi:hypothetical protein